MNKVVYSSEQLLAVENTHSECLSQQTGRIVILNGTEPVMSSLLGWRFHYWQLSTHVHTHVGREQIQAKQCNYAYWIGEATKTINNLNEHILVLYWEKLALQQQ